MSHRQHSASIFPVYAAVPDEAWRKIVDAVSEYRDLLGRGDQVSPEVFAAKYTDIPNDVLTRELSRTRDEAMLPTSTRGDR